MIVVVSLLAIVVGGFFVVRNADAIFDFDTPWKVRDYPGPGHGAVTVTIREGAYGTEIGQVLVEAGVVESTKAFVDAYNANTRSSGIGPGTYDLKYEMSAADAVAVLIEGPTRTALSVIPGQGVARIVEKAAAEGEIPAEDFQAALADPASIGLPAEANGSVEGWLAPGEYEIGPDDTAQTLLARMVAGRVEQLDALGVPADQRQTVLIKASIIEKEAPAGSFDTVARVIENRIAQDMALGMDAIDAYGLGKTADQITSAEFNDPNLPYASRVRKGLPPTPIGNPGATAIDAALHPAEGPWLFYVTVDLDTGETKFTADYQEFLAFKAEYQEWRRVNRPSEDG